MLILNLRRFFFRIFCNLYNNVIYLGEVRNDVIKEGRGERKREGVRK